MDVRSLYKSGSLVTVSNGLSEYRFEAMGVQEVRWGGGGGAEPAAEYTFFFGKRNENHELGAGVFVHKRIILAVKGFEIVSDRMSHIIVSCRWCPIVLLNVLAPTKDKIDYVKDSFYEELERVFDIRVFPEYHTKILLGNFSAKVGREDIFKLTIGKGNFHEISNYNGIRVVNFATSKNLTVKSTMFPLR
jgi:hypothetical protein